VDVYQESMMACLGQTKATDLDVSSEEMGSVVEILKAPKEDNAMKLVRGLKKWHRGCHLAARCYREPKEWTQKNCGSRGKLAATCRRMTCHAGDIITRDTARTLWYEEPREHGCSGRDNGHAQNATVA
jgi:hypothetical protein